MKTHRIAPLLAHAGIWVLGFSFPPIFQAQELTQKKKQFDTVSAHGIWTSPTELRQRPLEGHGWEAVLRAAKRNLSDHDLSDQNDHTNVDCLAAAIVYARTSDSAFREKAVQSIEELVASGNPGGRTLAWARNITGFVLAADLIGYQQPAFLEYLEKITHQWKCSQLDRSLRGMCEYKPNNWGKFGLQACAAVYAFQKDQKRLKEITEIYRRWVEGPMWEGTSQADTAWYPDLNNKLIINPAGTSINVKGKKIDLGGLQAGEMRRAGEPKFQPAFTDYAWEGIQPLVGAARILERAGYPIWEMGDRAIYRAAAALQDRLGSENPEWKATTYNDGWLLLFLDHAYNTDWSSTLDEKPRVKWGRGRGCGYGYVLGK